MSWQDVGWFRLCTDWLRDPVRLKHVAARVVETVVPSFLILVWLTPFVTAAVLSGLLAAMEFAWYEFVLEPYWWAGPYWERGPRDGETFTRW